MCNIIHSSLRLLAARMLAARLVVVFVALLSATRCNGYLTVKPLMPPSSSSSSSSSPPASASASTFSSSSLPRSPKPSSLMPSFTTVTSSSSSSVLYFFGKKKEEEAAVQVDEVEESSGSNPFDAITKAGLAGILAITLAEAVFWALGYPAALIYYKLVDNVWIDVLSKDGAIKAAGFSVGYGGFATAILQYRVTIAAIPLIPIMDKYAVPVVTKFFGDKFGAKKDEEVEIKGKGKGKSKAKKK